MRNDALGLSKNGPSGSVCQKLGRGASKTGAEIPKKALL